MKTLALIILAATACTREPAADSDRLARIEHRLDKVIEFINKNVPPPTPDPKLTYSVPIGALDPIEGPKDAKITIVEGFEFLCPYCYMVNPTVQQLLAKYPNDIRLVSKYLIIHGAPAVGPGMAACAANKQGKFAEMKKALWAHLFKLEDGKPRAQTDEVNLDNMEQIGAEVGVDAAKFKTELETNGCQQWIQDSEAALHPLGAGGTPAFFINGRFLNGAQPLATFDAVIQEELAKADKAISSGVKQADYYDSAVVAKGEKKVKGPLDD